MAPGEGAGASHPRGKGAESLSGVLGTGPTFKALALRLLLTPGKGVSPSKAPQPCEHHSPGNKLGAFGLAEPGDSLFNVTLHPGFSKGRVEQGRTLWGALGL